MDTSKTSPAGPRELRATWASAPYPVVLADRAGGVIELNDAASCILPEVRPGDWLHESAPNWLADAHQRLSHGIPSQNGSSSAPAGGRIGERVYEAHPTRDPDGDVVWWLVDDTDRRLAEEALRSERERTAFLAEASNALLSSLNVDRCMEVTAQLAATHLADAAVIVAPGKGRRHPMTSCVGENPVSRGTVEIDTSAMPGLSEALQGFPPVPSRWIDPASAPAWVIPEEMRGSVGSVVITPLPGHGLPGGVLILLRSADHTAFTEDAEIFARLFAARAGAALSAARMYAEQSSITTTLMRELLPPSLHQVNGVEFAGGYRASGQSERVGGDFYDVHPGADADQESLAVLGDVCGKGLEAAVLTGKIRNTLHALLPLADDHQRMLRLLNTALLNSHHTRFATLVLASAVRLERGVRLRVTSAGHPAPLVVRADGTVEEAETHGSLVGVLRDIKSATAAIDLAVGETCLLFTDGITEARGGPLGDEMFGESRLREALGECAGMPAEAVVERVQMLAAQWVGGGRHDDMAVVAITTPRGGPLTAMTLGSLGRRRA
ncbi:PP2C family protein-serine/threonine phosphatase [Streptomyces sp. SM12]|uniref:PP2C family protein-serine/threonine phosphatase n=1 Tax=Streptomyces sp. SM12 TaxID=1071602 RepID=UPI000CD4EB7D|nr:PP2C family protein-serine/threonine phosphatase [Streptomyces sp. SM12]